MTLTDFLNYPPWDQGQRREKWKTIGNMGGSVPRTWESRLEKGAEVQLLKIGMSFEYVGAKVMQAAIPDWQIGG